MIRQGKWGKPGTAPVFYHFRGLPIAFGLNVRPNNFSNLVAKVSSPAGRPVGGNRGQRPGKWGQRPIFSSKNRALSPFSRALSPVSRKSQKFCLDEKSS
ncbi:hypothetical protein COX18_04970 [Candidatus Desantisbacteria bacterium CG23_combo_of_CG06-09_8_20_14_all_40_23]|uniref:Uncharacterized protein n=1 Tax=Candidatus Desantisbacteria bacterium CG23_combo_of_CG06-09_8_20_14_all_40_23 TaxID=1974550 RepID=A0A2H0A6I0_9BACT|nr:MAG: hypothetical protein COX18_04970 [Candidatus Desantisbacteria bacterium CG23_combo_of_CG06-09_8_20_14_all_40_23]